MTGTRQLILAAGTALIIGIVVGVVVASGGDDDPGGSQPSTEAPSTSTTSTTSSTVVAAVEDGDTGPGRITDALVAIYELDEGDGTTVTDAIGGHDLAITEPDDVTWVPGGLRIDADTSITSSEPPSSITGPIVASGELTLEAWIETADLGQSGPARIVTISDGIRDRNLTLGQGVGRTDGDRIEARLRTTTADDDGHISLSTPAGSLTTELTHLAYTRAADGATRLYVDGVEQAAGTAGGDLSNWDAEHRLVLGNETDGERSWLGTLHLVAFHDRALSAAEIAQQAAVGPDGTGGAPPADDADPPADAPPEASGVGGDGEASGPVSWDRVSSADGELPAPPDQPDQTMSVVFDVDGDGADDIVIGGRRAESGPTLVWYGFDGTTWQRNTIDPDVLGLEAGGAFGDVDGDGDLDLIAGEDSRGNRLYWWANPSPELDQVWTRREIKSGGGNQHHDQAFGDVDGDGTPELLFWNQGDGRRLFLAEIPDDPTVEPWPATEIFQPDALGEGLDLGDIDGDGVLDVVAAGHWLRFAGGTEFTAFAVDAERTTAQVAVGQLVDGGRPEIVLDSGDFVGPLVVYAWDGTTWVPTVLDPDSRYGHSLDIGDVDGDGNLDIMSGEMALDGVEDPELKVFYGDGAGSFTEQPVSVGIEVHDSGLGDFDGDGDLDLSGKSFRRDGPRLDVWWNVDAGEALVGGALEGWARSVADGSVPWRTIFVEHADLDGDGRDDVVTGAWWWRNPGTVDGTWQRSTIGPPMNQMALVHDLDGDGDLDVLGTQAEGSEANAELAWAENDGTGAFTVRTNIEPATGRFLQGAIAVELRPGVLEVALSWEDGTDGLQVITVPDSSSLRDERWTRRIAHPEVFGEELSAGDIDDDGDVDLFDGEAWFRNDGGQLTRVVIQDLRGDPDRNRLVDVDGDGDLDAVVGFAHDRDGKVRWFEQGDDPAMPWAEHVIGDVGPAWASSLDIGDLDGDGDLDVVVGEHDNPDSGELAAVVFEQTSPNTWARRIVHVGDEHHDGTQLVDLDGDGDLDVVSIGWTHRRLHLYENLAR